MGILYDLQVWWHKFLRNFKSKHNVVLVEGIPTEKRIRLPMGNCSLCQKRLSITTGFFCDYCNKWHCEDHRLPEDHKCSNPKTPSIMKSARISYSKSE